MNDSDATGTATLTLEGDQLTINIESQGLAPGLPHAQHIHGDLPDGTELVSTCPGPDADVNGDGVVDTVEGQPFYGMILTSLTTEGDTSPDSGLAVERFPVAEDDGSLSYSRTFTVNPELNVEDLADYAIVQHGIDQDGSGMYDGDIMSPLDESVPREATLPADCGVIDAMPTGGVDAGAGGLQADPGSDGSDNGALTILIAGSGAAALALGAWFATRKLAAQR